MLPFFNKKNMATNKIYTVIGGRGQGKTPFILGGDFEEGLASIYLKKGMSVLVIDEFDHHKYRHVPSLSPTDYKILSSRPGIYRTLCKLQNMPTLFPHLANVWNTLIIFEDCFKYIPQRLTKDQVAILGNSKQQNNCLVFMHWCWGLAQPDIIRMTNYFVIFKTSDSPEARKDYLKGCYDKCMYAFNHISSKKHGKPYVIVDSGV